MGSMKRRLLDVLACPRCQHHPLMMEVVSDDGVEVMEGRLICSRCGEIYQITDGIPHLLPPEGTLS